MGMSRIIVLDLGKFNSVACIMEGASRRHAFATVATTPEKFKRDSADSAE